MGTRSVLTLHVWVEKVPGGCGHQVFWVSPIVMSDNVCEPREELREGMLCLLCLQSSAESTMSGPSQGHGTTARVGAHLPCSLTLFLQEKENTDPQRQKLGESWQLRCEARKW